MNLLEELKAEHDLARFRLGISHTKLAEAQNDVDNDLQESLLRGRLSSSLEIAQKHLIIGERQRVDYTNYRAERAIRWIVPIKFYVGSTPWHREVQVLLKAFDEDKRADRDFAVKDFHWED